MDQTSATERSINMEPELTNDAPTPDPFDTALDGLIAQSKTIPPQAEAPLKAEAAPDEPPVKAEVTQKPVVKVEEPEEDLRASVLDEKPAEQEEQTQELNEYPPTVVSKKAREHWDALKAERNQERKAREAAEKRVRELESSSGVKSPEVSVLTKERDEWKAKAEAADKELALDHIEKTTEFQEKVLKPGSEAEGFIQKMIETYSLNPQDIIKALEEENEIKRNEALSDIADDINGRLNQEKFYRMTEQLLTARMAEDELRNNSHGTRELAEAKRKEEEASKALMAKEEYEQSFARVIEKSAPKLSVLEDTWTQITDASKAENFDEMSSLNKAFAVLSSHSLPVLLKKYNAIVKENTQLKEVQKARSAASPSAGTGTATNPTANDDEDFMPRLTNFMSSNGYKA